jgi:hypothetical protein
MGILRDLKLFGDHCRCDGPHKSLQQNNPSSCNAIFFANPIEKLRPAGFAFVAAAFRRANAFCIARLGFCSARIAFCGLPVRPRFAVGGASGSAAERSSSPTRPWPSSSLAAVANVFLGAGGRSASRDEGPLFDCSVDRNTPPPRTGLAFVAAAFRPADRFCIVRLGFCSVRIAFCRWRCARLCRRSFLPHHPPLAVIQPARRSQRLSWRRREERLSRRRTPLRLPPRTQNPAPSPTRPWPSS